MNRLQPGRYIVAVSGGVDSMVLLDMLRGQNGLNLIVAHADHGMRPDSPLDSALVAEYCRKHAITFVQKCLRLPPNASEDVARKARWLFLRQCSKKYKAQAILAAHHQDDLVETALLAIIRGTGWRGLAPFMPTPGIVRPLLNLTKNDIIRYARKHAVPWREDPTNTQEKYARNYIRHTLIPTLDQKSLHWRVTFLQQIRKQQQFRLIIEQNLDTWLAKNVQLLLSSQAAICPRYALIMLPRTVAYECLQQILRAATGKSLQRPLAETALLFVKTAKPRKILQLSKNWQLRAESANVVVEPRQDVVSLDKH